MLACRTREEAISALRGDAPGKVLSVTKDQDAAKVAFLFPGQGAQHLNMGTEVYENEPVFRDAGRSLLRDPAADRRIGSA
mgnify:CR=1 FL=1